MDEQANFNCFDKAWRLHERELKAYLIRRSASYEEAEDLLQTVFLKALKHGKDFCAMTNARPWLFQVARNTLIDQYRSNHSVEDSQEELTVNEPDEPTVEALSECLPRTLSELSQLDREIITLCDLDGLPQAEYAAMKGVGLSATKSRLQRARKKLKTILKRNCQIKFDSSGNVCCFVPRPPFK